MRPNDPKRDPTKPETMKPSKYARLPASYGKPLFKKDRHFIQAGEEENKPRYFVAGGRQEPADIVDVNTFNAKPVDDKGKPLTETYGDGKVKNLAGTVEIDGEPSSVHFPDGSKSERLHVGCYITHGEASSANIYVSEELGTLLRRKNPKIASHIDNAKKKMGLTHMACASEVALFKKLLTSKKMHFAVEAYRFTADYIRTPLTFSLEPLSQLGKIILPLAYLSTLLVVPATVFTATGWGFPGSNTFCPIMYGTRQIGFGTNNDASFFTEPAASCSTVMGNVGHEDDTLYCYLNTPLSDIASYNMPDDTGWGASSFSRQLVDIDAADLSSTKHALSSTDWAKAEAAEMAKAEAVLQADLLKAKVDLVSLDQWRTARPNVSASGPASSEFFLRPNNRALQAITTVPSKQPQPKHEVSFLDFVEGKTMARRELSLCCTHICCTSEDKYCNECTDVSCCHGCATITSHSCYVAPPPPSPPQSQASTTCATSTCARPYGGTALAPIDDGNCDRTFSNRPNIDLCMSSTPVGEACWVPAEDLTSAYGCGDGSEYCYRCNQLQYGSCSDCMPPPLFIYAAHRHPSCLITSVPKHLCLPSAVSLLDSLPCFPPYPSLLLHPALPLDPAFPSHLAFPSHSDLPSHPSRPVACHRQDRRQVRNAESAADPAEVAPVLVLLLLLLFELRRIIQLLQRHLLVRMPKLLDRRWNVRLRVQ